MLTYANLQSRVLRWIDEGDNTASTTTALVQDALNASHRRLAGKRNWRWLKWPREETIVTVANTRVYALHPQCAKIRTMWDTNNNTYVPSVPLAQWPQVGVNRSSTLAYPYGYTFGPVWPVAVQPSSTVITAVSSSGSDGSGPAVVVTGLDTSSNYVSETLTLTGATPVTSTNTYRHISSVTKTGTFVGTVTLKSGSTTLLTLSVTEYGKQYPTIEFVESPQAAITISYTFQRGPRLLSVDNDIPDTFPNDSAEIHVYDVLLDLSTYNTELGVKEQNIWRIRYDELYNQLLQADDEQVVGSLPRSVRRVAGDYMNVVLN